METYLNLPGGLRKSIWTLAFGISPLFKSKWKHCILYFRFAGKSYGIHFHTNIIRPKCFHRLCFLLQWTAGSLNVITGNIARDQCDLNFHRGVFSVDVIGGFHQHRSCSSQFFFLFSHFRLRYSGECKDFPCLFSSAMNLKRGKSTGIIPFSEQREDVHNIWMYAIGVVFILPVIIEIRTFFFCRQLTGKLRGR